jgi:hypothetical protein
MQISVEGWRASPGEWEAVRSIPRDQLPALTEQQREVARKMGVPEEDYARSALAGERTQNALLAKTEMFARLLEKKIRDLGFKASVQNIVLRTLEHAFEVVLNTNGSYLPLRIKEDVVDDLFEAGSSEAEEKLSRILNATVGVRERQ